MTEITFSSDIEVKLVRHMAADDYVVQAAQVSAKGENNPDTVPERLINALLKGRHGSPFEHTSFTFFVKAPLFVFREWQRHRMSSFNEMSGRYTVLPGEFYRLSEERNLMLDPDSTKMKPGFLMDKFAHRAVNQQLEITAKNSWEFYQNQIEYGVAPEVARMVLPLNIYSQMYWTVNARSLMNFLSLRVESDDSLVRSYPQYEIQLGAEKVEVEFARLMPATYKAFVGNGRVAP